MRLLPHVLLVGLVAGQVEYPSYVTFPQQVAPITVLRGDPDDPRLSKGYWFLSPFESDYTALAVGPQIVDSHGRLVWNGNATVQVRGQAAHLCSFRSPELNTICYNDAFSRSGHAVGTLKFLSNSYELVAEFGEANGLLPPDNHELETPPVTNGDTFIQQVFQPTPADLSGFGGPKQGFVLAGCFQERNSFTGDVEFQWCTYPSIPVDKTYVYLKSQQKNLTNAIAGLGTEMFGWDYAHMNAVSRTDGGDYIISCRHLSAIFKIAGNNSTSKQKPGSVLWQLGGKDPTIKSEGFTFSKQHGVRWRETRGNTTLITFFDNATDGRARGNTSDASSGKEILIDTTTNVATLVHQYDMPDGLLSAAQGWMQWLDNGNVAISWGRIGYYSEFTREGELLYHAQFSGGTMECYRIWKYPWHAIPSYPPSLVLYAQTCDNQLYAYASWNGATDVASYRFYKGNNESGPWKLASTERKADFEVFSDLHAFALFGYVEALGSDGEVIGTSAVTKVFIPAPSMANCTATSCDKLTNYTISSLSVADECIAKITDLNSTNTTDDGALLGVPVDTSQIQNIPAPAVDDPNSLGLDPMLGLSRGHEHPQTWYNVLSGGVDSLVWLLFFLSASFAVCYTFYKLYRSLRPRNAAAFLK